MMGKLIGIAVLFGLCLALVSLAPLEGTLPMASAHQKAKAKPLPTGQLETVVLYDPTIGELPEGIAVDKAGNLFVTLAPLGQIRKIAPDGSEAVFATLDPAIFPPAVGAIGLAVDAPGNVYACLMSNNPTTHGVWRVSRDGYFQDRLPGTDQILFPNALAFDKVGNLYVTDLVMGAVWRIPPDGVAEVWIQDAMLSGDGSLGLGLPLGANGIVYRHGEVLVANTEGARIVRIPVLADGTAGTLEVIVEDPILYPTDGIALDVRGNIYAVTSTDMLLRISFDGSSIDVLATAKDGLDEPASLAFGTGKGNRKSIFFTNFAFLQNGGAGPSVMKIGVGVPGVPLP
jgi:sugar lactone lactonase YvrE